MAAEVMAVEGMAAEVMAVEGMAAEVMAVEGMASEVMAVEGMASDTDPAKNTVVKKSLLLKLEKCKSEKETIS
jgi:hypothetical protein